MILGQGSYGEVKVRDGQAVKKFSKLSHLIQEYLALKYLDDCDHVVHTTGVDFRALELNMELYDCSLRKWLEDNRANGSIDEDTIMKILQNILLGLVELHDRQLAHGDLKPGNVLVRNDPLKVVLGDCGFVSVAKYAKVDRTAAIYRDPVVSHDFTHDMFSFGICFLEMIAEIKINRQATYTELKQIIKDKVTNPEYRKIIYNLLHEDKDRRPTARSLLYRMFHVNPKRWTCPKEVLTQSPDLIKINTSGSASNNEDINRSIKSSRVVTSILTDDRKYIRSLIKTTAYRFEVNRGKKGYGALLSYLDIHRIDPSDYRIYTAATLMILSSIFGKSGFREQEVIALCENRNDLNFLFKILKEMLSDPMFINILLAP